MHVLRRRIGIYVSFNIDEAYTICLYTCVERYMYLDIARSKILSERPSNIPSTNIVVDSAYDFVESASNRLQNYIGKYLGPYIRQFNVPGACCWDAFARV